MSRVTRTLSLVAAAAVMAPIAVPAVGQAVSQIRFARGNDNTSVKGAITGRQYRDYKLAVGNGQTLGVSLITKGNLYFNILPPGSRDVAVYNSSIDGNDATGIKTRAGTYTIRVYAMGAAKSSTRAIPFQLSVSVVNF